MGSAPWATLALTFVRDNSEFVTALETSPGALTFGLDPVLHCERPILAGKSKAGVSAEAFLKEGLGPGRGPHSFLGR